MRNKFKKKSPQAFLQQGFLKMWIFTYVQINADKNNIHKCVLPLNIFWEMFDEKKNEKVYSGAWKKLLTGSLHGTFESNYSKTIFYFKFTFTMIFFTFF